MKLLNKLNGWQRLWLLATVAAQIWGITRYSAWVYPSIRFSYEHCEDWPDCKVLKPLHEVILTDMSINLGLLVVCLAAYVVTYVAVIIVRWVISGFKKEN